MPVLSSDTSDKSAYRPLSVAFRDVSPACAAPSVMAHFAFAPLALDLPGFFHRRYAEFCA